MELNKENLRKNIREIIAKTEIIDIHTHLYPSEFNSLFKYGIDNLLTYQYLIEEVLNYIEMDAKVFLALEQFKQADIVWEELFIKRTPISTATKNIITILNKLDIPIKKTGLSYYRDIFRNIELNNHIDNVFHIANVKKVTMTNDPFSDEEIKYWSSNDDYDKRFLASLRVDMLVNNWSDCYQILLKRGYKVTYEINDSTINEINRFLRYWVNQIRPTHLDASLAPEMFFDGNSISSKIFRKCIIQVAKEFNLSILLMLGVVRQINPSFGEAGDGVGKFDLNKIRSICEEHTDVKFMITCLSKENQHELTVLSKKFANLTVFSCWWFMNTTSLLSETTKMRLELLGRNFIYNHSDCKVLEQLISKWDTSRKVLEDILYNEYNSLLDLSWPLSVSDIELDVKNLFGHNLKFTKSYI